MPLLDYVSKPAGWEQAFVNEAYLALSTMEDLCKSPSSIAKIAKLFKGVLPVFTAGEVYSEKFGKFLSTSILFKFAGDLPRFFLRDFAIQPEKHHYSFEQVFDTVGDFASILSGFFAFPAANALKATNAVSSFCFHSISAVRSWQDVSFLESNKNSQLAVSRHPNQVYCEFLKVVKNVICAALAVFAMLKCCGRDLLSRKATSCLTVAASVLAVGLAAYKARTEKLAHLEPGKMPIY